MSSHYFPCLNCGKFVCPIGQNKCERCEYGHKAKKCPKRVSVSTYASHEWIHGDCKVPVEDPNAWQCGDCGKDGIPSDVDWCPVCAEHAEYEKAQRMAEISKAAKLRQVGGDHYIKYAIQPFDIIDCYGLNFYAGNALKYLLRYRDKGGVQDLQKAKHYIEKLIETTDDTRS